MEGVYRVHSNNAKSDIDTIFKHKAKHLICCFSESGALSKPIMWGYYANGFKGVAIEVEVDETAFGAGSDFLERMTYPPDQYVPTPGNDAKESAINILCRKLPAWGHEEEYRLLTSQSSNAYRFGTITRLIVGYSYPKTQKRLTGDDRWNRAGEYLCRAKWLIDVAECKGIPVAIAQMKDATVSIRDISYKDLRKML